MTSHPVKTVSSMIGDVPPMPSVDVLIVGAGPSGLGAAAELRRLGVGKVLVVERGTEAGGIPRHCGHSPFGMREFSRILGGAAYAERLTDAALSTGADILTRHTVVSVDAEGAVLATPDGMKRIRAKRILLATGARESTRASQLISGERPIGIMNTGALQAYAYIEKLAPFRRPLIVGTELVSMSAILSARSLGARPAAIIEANPDATARWPLALLPRLYGIPMYYNTKIVDISGRGRVEKVTLLTADGKIFDVDCDGIVFTGKFTPEASLARSSGIEIDVGSGGPSIDSFGRTSLSTVFASGNLLRPIETAGWSWAEGKRVASALAMDLAGDELPLQGLPVSRSGTVKLTVPQRLAIDPRAPFKTIQIRLNARFDGHLVAQADGQEIWSRRITSQPERRILVAINEMRIPAGARSITFTTR